MMSAAFLCGILVAKARNLNINAMLNLAIAIYLKVVLNVAS